MNRKVLALLVLFVLTAGSLVQECGASTDSKYTGATYEHNKKFENADVINGIDVSQYQNEIDWNKVKDDGVEFAVIRVGGRGYSEMGRMYFDDYYKKNIEGAKKAGIDVGVYYFSQAKTEAEAVEEAEHCLSLLGDYEIDMPVYMDYEHASDLLNPGRIKNLTKEQRTKNVMAFCERIKESGYEAGFYSNLLFLRNSVDGKTIGEKYHVWAAQYNNKCSYENDYGIWQYSSKGKVNGINGIVDCNFQYKLDISGFDVQLSFLSSVYDGEEKKPEVTISDLKENVDFTLEYKNNINAGEARVAITGKGLYKGRKEIPFDIEVADIKDRNVTLSYSEIEYDGNAKEPEVSVEGLALGRDFNVTYSDNVRVGTAAVTITGTGNYKGVIITNFVIKDTKTGAEALFKDSNKVRIYGSDRYETAINAAEALKISLGRNKFDSVIIACGDDYADALSGSYLASVKKAPVLLVNRYNELRVKNYIEGNLENDGTIYILGGEGAVSKGFEDSFLEYKTIRLGGSTRFETNIAILEEAGVKGKDLLVCSAFDYADSLSSSSAGRPILLIDENLNDIQEAYLKGAAGDSSLEKCYLIGGEGAVSKTAEQEFKGIFKSVERLGGQNRFETSLAIANEFFDRESKVVTLAYGYDYPDGLTGGAVAESVNSPVLLVSEKNIYYAKKYVRSISADRVVVMGGHILVPDEQVYEIMNHTL